MYIQRVIKISRFQYKIFSEERIFCLSYKNLMKYEIREETELPEETYQKIRKDVLLPSAKRKAMDLLIRSDQTEQELRRKLERKEFDEETIEEAVAYVKRFHYIDDTRYAENFVRFRSGGKSKKQVKLELQRKGIEKGIAEELISETVNEEEVLERLIQKKVGNRSKLDRDEQRKIMAYLYRRGFEGELIRSKMRKWLDREWDEDSSE